MTEYLRKPRWRYSFIAITPGVGYVGQVPEPFRARSSQFIPNCSSRYQSLNPAQQMTTNYDQEFLIQP